MSDEVTLEQARQAMADDEQRRMTAAAQAIKEVLAEHRCEIVAVPQIAQDGRIVAVVQVVAKS